MDLQLKEQVDLRAYNTLGLPSRARYFAELNMLSQCPAATDFARQHRIPMLILGAGSNIVLSEDFPGLVVKVCITGITLEERDECVLVTAGAGESWTELVEYCLSHACYGLENLSLIPGTVGAAPIQNIGAYGVELKRVFHSLRGWDCAMREWRELSAEDCRFGYRDSVFKRALRERFIISSVTLKLSHKPIVDVRYRALEQELNDRGIDSPSPQEVAESVVAIRQRKLPDPKNLANAGSFFKNPLVDAEQYQQLQVQYPGLVAYPQADGAFKLAAGWLLESAGWKGRREGEVGMHAEQALVLVNYGGATGAQVIEFAERVRADIRERFAVELEIEPGVF